MKILHILREPADAFCQEVMERQGREHRITVVALQEASGSLEDLPGHKVALEDKSEGDSPRLALPRVGYGELLDLIFEHDRLFCW